VAGGGVMTEPQTTRDLDAQAFVTMLEDDEHIEALLKAVRDRHTLDLGGPAMSALSRALGNVEMLRIELRLIRNYTLGGA
jgi:hypothetical protein